MSRSEGTGSLGGSGLRDGQRGVGFGVQHHGGENRAGSTVDRCMVHLGQHREVAALQALDHIQLPERTRPVTVAV